MARQDSMAEKIQIIPTERAALLIIEERERKIGRNKYEKSKQT